MTRTKQSSEDTARVGLVAAYRLMSLGRDAEAEKAFVSAATIPGVDTGALYEGVAQAMRNQGKLVEAMRLLDLGLARFPGHASLHFIRSLILLGLGQFAEGWPEYEIRLKTPQRCYLPRAVTWPRWMGPGESRGGKILIWTEQGYGDEIMFASLIHLLFPYFNQITFECSRDTAQLFRRSFPDVRVFPVELSGAMPEAFKNETFDYECPLASLPLALGRDRPPAPHAWLVPDPALTNNLRDALISKAAGRRIVGVSWRGGTFITRQIARSLELKQLQPILNAPDTLFVAIQHDMKLAELQSVKTEICSWPNLLTQLDSLTALIGACDEIVTVCGTNVHLAGAMGKKVSVLAPLAPEWRYGFAGDRMPWYPDVKVFRQEKYGVWDSVIARIANELAAHA
jgi:hypothetical protein